MGLSYHTTGVNVHALRSIAHGSLNTSTFVAVGSAVAARDTVIMIKITNTMDVGVLISYDSGTTTHEVVQAGESLVIDLAQNMMHLLREETVQAKLVSASSSGTVYISAYKR